VKRALTGGWQRATQLGRLVTGHRRLTTFCRSLLAAVALVLVSPFITVHLAQVCYAQSETASISGRVTDPHGGVVPNTEVEAIQEDTNVRTTTQTTADGLYYFASLHPASYRIVVSKDGFKQVIQADVVLHVQDSLTLNFALQLGSVNESITVTADQNNINTTDGSVSTVVDRAYVENMPLNGRSFQDLILLTPGVVTSSPQSQIASIGQQGEFSVNGQRTESNYYSVDGVSANVGAIPGSPAAVTAAVSGSLPVSTALGTTQGLVSVDALQEFRVESSTYSAEYGRNPGGQFDFVTRSGTNQWHGSAFDYLRNGAFDANDWFNDYYGLAQPAERQNDFGGTLGGPVSIPALYDGKDRTFFFFSYEGLRLEQPQEASISYVPTVALRESAPSALQPVLNAFPVPNCPSSATNCTNDLGNGLGDFIGTWSSPSQIDSASLRLDHSIGTWLKLFFRFSDTSSSLETRLNGLLDGNPANSSLTPYTVRTFTLGATAAVSTHVANSFRLNYTSNATASSISIGSFGGNTVASLRQLQGFTDPDSQVYVFLFFNGYYAGLLQTQESGKTKQWNAVDTVSAVLGRHDIKLGVDYRRVASVGITPQIAAYDYFESGSVQTNTPDYVYGVTSANTYPVYVNFSAFAEDEWHVRPRLSLSMGLRWDVNPAPSASSGIVPYTVVGEGNLSTVTLAPEGTPLWKTTWLNFAPRFGAAFIVRNTPGWETVLRGGGGLFFDTGQQVGSAGYQGVGLSGFASPSGSFPIPPAEFIAPIVNPPPPPYDAVFGFYPRLQLPYTLQWNLSVEQAIGKSQALTVSYVGSHAGRLLEESELNVQPFNPNFEYLIFFQNGLTSDYNALQLQFQRRLSHGLQALASYTWSHCQDYASYNTALSYQRGNCDFDVRQNFSSAFSYDLPNASSNRTLGALLRHWGLDDRFTARTGFPVTLTSGLDVVNPATQKTFSGGLDVVPGQPFYIYGSQCAAVYGDGLSCPGGRAINPNAFSEPAAGGLGDAPRNFVRGFGAWQMDLAVRREFPIHEGLKLQFRAEAFNVFNHPNFGVINSTYCPPGPGCTFGQATATLASSLGILSPLYQQGGPRSMQFALKLIF
jgi:Carboxypeptidase regulatory-like domain/TonB dependent receptor